MIGAKIQSYQTLKSLTLIRPCEVSRYFCSRVWWRWWCTGGWGQTDPVSRRRPTLSLGQTDPLSRRRPRTRMRSYLPTTSWWECCLPDTTVTSETRSGPPGWATSGTTRCSDIVSGQDVELVNLPEDSSVLAPAEVSAVALDFKVLHPVVITRLGVFPDGPQQQFQGNVTVKLFQLDQQEAVVMAHFTSTSPGTSMNGVWYKSVEQFILPKGFEGTLVWESLYSTGLTTVNDASRVQLNSGGGALKLSSIAEGILPHRSALGFPGVAGGFTFTVYDGEALSKMLLGRAGRFESHASRLRGEDVSLEQESLRHGDMVFVDVVDTYRNVPSKLLQFYKWSVGNADFNLLLKTDDDCYVDVDAVLMKIDHKGLNRKDLWWGNFRQSWAVDRVGKWQELEYAGPAYPAFACGSGYVLSRDLVTWLADNAEKLKAYQGEDVSMGIWMAAVGPHKYQDPGWLCEKQCYVDMLSSPQHTAEELRTLWDRKRACGDPCGCPWGHHH